MSTCNVESCVIQAPAARTWEALRRQDFAFWSLVKSVEFSTSPCEVGGIRTTVFADGTVQKHRLLALSETDRSLTYELIDSEPAAPSLSAQHTLQVFSVTADNSSFVQWSSDFSSDRSTEVVEDAKFKKIDALAELAKSLAKH
ncbi:hypothetical protein IWQ56_000428 [Coemansia nantahalensis]|uniref:Uncharacterized protein n=1 Tax=Coemansia nantahalensis TaxID=2789366 RepID=A0ACC1K5Q9_9FUNG|nr:hypothetical protein IWQ57_001095 [Coemansia nantahalensis]KAJ2774784.1 hypothetical protein IWQ56_000428 [Coemansia nantahalensis]